MEKIMNFTFYKLLFEQSLDAILITNPTGEIIDANPAACDILKMTEKEIIIGGRNAVVDLNDPRLEAGLIERKNKGYIRTELNLKRKNGEIFPVSLTSKIFKDEYGIERTVIIFRDITIYKNAEKVVLQNTQDHKKNAETDFLTGALNRRGFMSRFSRLIRRSKTKNSHFCLIFVDIDNLKRINDKYGHIRGDNALKRFTKIVKSTLFNNSYVSRFGGDEFILCLPDTERAVAIEIAKQMKNKLHQIKFSGDKEVPCLTASFGVVSSRDFKWTNAKEIIARADEYMYMAKRIKDSVYFGE